METINFIAELWGFGFMAASLALLFNQQLIKKFFQFTEDELSVFCHGFLSFLIGLATVLNVAWANNWKVAVAILGWLAIIKGVMFLMLPKTAKNLIGKIENKEWTPWALLAVLIIGLFLIYLGFNN